MTTPFEVITSHRSIRKYADDQVKPQHLQQILEAAKAAPTSVNGQQFSVIVVTDPEVKAKLAQVAGNQGYIASCPVFLLFCADFSRVAKALDNQGLPFGAMASTEATLVGAVDCGIAFANSMTVAESLGYGIVPIGAVRRDPAEVIDLFELPRYVYPILGMCIGVPAEDPGQKPRFDRGVLVHEEKYRPITDRELAEYDRTIAGYMDRRTGGESRRTWSEGPAAIYQSSYFPKVDPTLAEQGFKG
ncbi:MAG: NADPH-dependent oxidoreductase [Actinomycetaceae bacterium]|nr:NADPH-dependent oxidoreductase [Actinomycetaceae bacterium]